MATPKEQHDARDLARSGQMPAPGRDEQVEGELPRSQAAPTGAEEQGDGQPENELELHDHTGGVDAVGRGQVRRDVRGHSPS